MTKISSRDVLDILRRFDKADFDNIPRQIKDLRVSNPYEGTTMASFVFLKDWYYIIFDEKADDDTDDLLGIIKTKKQDVTGVFLENPNDERQTYALPFKGKSCYLFLAVASTKRLDVLLAEKYPENSRSTWQKFVKSGQVRVNGEIVKSPKKSILETDDISIEMPAIEDYKEKSLPIIYIDDNVIVVNKPAGVLTHSKGVVNEEFTVSDFFRRYTDFNLETNRAGIVHRLDRDTSGIIIGARNQETARMLQKQFADRKTKKTYVAILNGHPKLDKANIDLPIKRNPAKPSTFLVDSNGKMAITRYDVIESSDNYSLVRLRPLTGRTHQLRVHMKYLNTPILGDRVYGKESKRLYLHAYSLEITIPDGDRKTFVAEVPEEFHEYFETISL